MRLNKYAACLLMLGLLLSSCQTPQRRRVIERMDRLQADQSAVQARAETDLAQAKLTAAKQREEDFHLIESLGQRLESLSRELEELKARPVSSAAPAPVPPPPSTTPPATGSQKTESGASDWKAEVERKRAEIESQQARTWEELAKAQAQAETARLASEAAQKTVTPGQKAETFVGQKLPVTKFVESTGRLLDLNSLQNQKTVVLVVMKGFYSQGICLFCTKQTAGLARMAEEFRQANAEVLVVYPGREEHINAFVASVRDYQKSSDSNFKLPFRVLLDVNQDAVRALNIAGDLAHPTSFILDKAGLVRYQYVGKTLSDRPGAEALLGEVKKLGEAAK